jgi:hypothetical protein
MQTQLLASALAALALSPTLTMAQESQAQRMYRQMDEDAQRVLEFIEIRGLPRPPHRSDEWRGTSGRGGQARPWPRGRGHPPRKATRKRYRHAALPWRASIGRSHFAGPRHPVPTWAPTRVHAPAPAISLR